MKNISHVNDKSSYMLTENRPNKNNKLNLKKLDIEKSFKEVYSKPDDLRKFHDQYAIDIFKCKILEKKRETSSEKRKKEKIKHERDKSKLVNQLKNSIKNSSKILSDVKLSINKKIYFNNFKLEKYKFIENIAKKNDKKSCFFMTENSNYSYKTTDKTNSKLNTISVLNSVLSKNVVKEKYINDKVNNIQKLNIKNIIGRNITGKNESTIETSNLNTISNCNRVVDKTFKCSNKTEERLITKKNKREYSSYKTIEIDNDDCIKDKNKIIRFSSKFNGINEKIKNEFEFGSENINNINSLENDKNKGKKQLKILKNFKSTKSLSFLRNDLFNKANQLQEKLVNFETNLNLKRKIEDKTLLEMYKKEKINTDYYIRDKNTGKVICLTNDCLKNLEILQKLDDVNIYNDWEFFKRKFGMINKGDKLIEKHLPTTKYKDNYLNVENILNKMIIKSGINKINKENLN